MDTVVQSSNVLDLLLCCLRESTENCVEVSSLLLLLFRTRGQDCVQYVKELNVIPSLLSCFDNPIKVKTEDEEEAKEAEKEIMVRIEIISNEQSNIWRTMNAIDVLSSIHNEVREVLQDSDWKKYKELSHMYIS